MRKFVDVIPENSKVLDAGCGNGKNMNYIKNKSIDVVGIDFSEKLLEICKNKWLFCISKRAKRSFKFFVCILSNCTIS